VSKNELRMELYEEYGRQFDEVRFLQAWPLLRTISSSRLRLLLLARARTYPNEPATTEEQIPPSLAGFCLLNNN
jgi:hypothetical protein